MYISDDLLENFDLVKSSRGQSMISSSNKYVQVSNLKMTYFGLVTQIVQNLERTRICTHLKLEVLPKNKVIYLQGIIIVSQREQFTKVRQYIRIVSRFKFIIYTFFNCLSLVATKEAPRSYKIGHRFCSQLSKC